MKILATNPFSTRYTRPGALPFLFPPDLDARRLLERAAAANWRGQIVGDHGTGKSTLLAALAEEAVRFGRKPMLVVLHDGERHLPAEVRNRRFDAQDLLLIDGYEQLGRFARARLLWHSRRAGCGLIVTTHRRAALPVLFRTRATLDVAREVVSALLASEDALTEPTLVNDRDIAVAYAAHGGNLREMLFDLYDVYEHRVHEDRSSLARNAAHPV